MTKSTPYLAIFAILLAGSVAWLFDLYWITLIALFVACECLYRATKLIDQLTAKQVSTKSFP